MFLMSLESFGVEVNWIGFAIRGFFKSSPCSMVRTWSSRGNGRRSSKKYNFYIRSKPRITAWNFNLQWLPSFPDWAYWLAFRPSIFLSFISAKLLLNSEPSKTHQQLDNKLETSIHMASRPFDWCVYWNIQHFQRGFRFSYLPPQQIISAGLCVVHVRLVGCFLATCSMKLADSSISPVAVRPPTCKICAKINGVHFLQFSGVGRPQKWEFSVTSSVA